MPPCAEAASPTRHCKQVATGTHTAAQPPVPRSDFRGIFTASGAAEDAAGRLAALDQGFHFRLLHTPLASMRRAARPADGGAATGWACQHQSVPCAASSLPKVYEAPVLMLGEDLGGQACTKESSDGSPRSAAEQAPAARCRACDLIYQAPCPPETFASGCSKVIASSMTDENLPHSGFAQKSSKLAHSRTRPSRIAPMTALDGLDVELLPMCRLHHPLASLLVRVSIRFRPSNIATAVSASRTVRPRHGSMSPRLTNVAV